MPKKNLPSVEPTMVHLEVGDYSACGLNLRFFPELKTAVTTYLTTCKKCLEKVGFSGNISSS